MWTNIVQPDSPQMPKWRTRMACWMPKDTNTHIEYVIPHLHWADVKTWGSHSYIIHTLLVFSFSKKNDNIQEAITHLH